MSPTTLRFNKARVGEHWRFVYYTQKYNNKTTGFTINKYLIQESHDKIADYTVFLKKM